MPVLLLLLAAALVFGRKRADPGNPAVATDALDAALLAVRPFRFAPMTIGMLLKSAADRISAEHAAATSVLDQHRSLAAARHISHQLNVGLGWGATTAALAALEERARQWPIWLDWWFQRRDALPADLRSDELATLQTWLDRFAGGKTPIQVAADLAAGAVV